MNSIVAFVASAFIVYLICAIPFSLIIGKLFYGRDLRNEGSKNLGATNTLRVLGIKAGIVTAILDTGKGTISIAISVLLASLLGQRLSPVQAIILMIIAVMAHSYSIYVGLKGGKGVAVAEGALLWIAPQVAVALVVIFVGVILITKYVSLGSLTAAVSLPILVALTYSHDWAVNAIMLLVAGFVVWKHRTNIKRLLSHSERRLTWPPNRDFKTPA
jgi:glycerol-3-phosphate acyltransferase PlsY